jgi:serine/threonine protein kinase
MSDPDSRLSWTPPAPEALAADFPKLEIESLLALGGMSAVYRVRQTSLDRLAVLKVMPLETGEGEGAALRFQTEARALASVRDRGVVEVYDFGTTNSGYLYLLLEYEGGGDLRRWMEARTGPITPEEALGIASSIAGGVAAAHRRGIVHGDLKPDNIFIDGDGQLKVGDFGLAGTGGMATATHYTPGYTAPEILAGDHRNTTQTDVYAIGATLFELLLRATPPLETGNLALQLQKVPVPLAEVIGWALQPDPTRRPADAVEYRSALDKAAAALGESPRPRISNPTIFKNPRASSQPAAPSKPSRPSPILIAAGAAALLAIGYAIFKPATPANDPVVAAPQISATPALPEPEAPGPAPTVAATSDPIPPGTPTAPLTPETGVTTPNSPPTEPIVPPAPPAPAIAVLPINPPEDPADQDWLDEGKATSSPGATTVSKGPATDEEIKAWNPDWTIEAPRGKEGSSIRFSSTQDEGNRVLTVAPFSGTRPASLSRITTLSQDRPMQLSIRVAAHSDGKADWLLKAFVNDQPLSKPQTITNRPGRPRWLTLTWDLSAWKGKQVNLRLENHNGGEVNWWFEHSLWSWIRLEPLSDVLVNATFRPANASKDVVDPGFVDLFSVNQAGGWKGTEAGGLSFNQGVATTFTRPGGDGKGLVWFTKRMFRDFVVQLEFKTDSPQARSGILLRGVDPDISSVTSSAVSGVEVAIHGDTISQTGTGSLAGEKAPTSLPLKSGDWNKLEIAVTGTRHLIKLNGQLINEWNSPGNASGYLALQHFRGEGEVQFRKVWIREISPGVATLATPAKPSSGPTRRLGIPADARPFNGKWYRYYEEKMLWRMAKKRCEDLKGHLVFIQDQATQDFLNTLTDKPFWGGASDEKKEGEWLWLDGSPMVFSKWGGDQPDNGGGREDFLVVHPESWNDNRNDASIRGFICQWD